MKNVMCSRCKERPAVIFISKVDGDKTSPEGLCLKCALDMNIGPIKQMMQSMGITEDDIDAVSEQFDGMFGSDELGDDFELGGAGTFPFMQAFMNQDMSENNEDIAQKTEEDFSHSLSLSWL